MKQPLSAPGTVTATVALQHTAGGPLSLESVELGPLATDEILVRTAGVGVCHTDWTAAAGKVPLPTPFVLGHEGAGTVTAVGAKVSTLAVGDKVVLSFDACRSCPQCTAGHPAYCVLSAALNYTGTRPDGTTTMGLKGQPVHGSWFGQSSFATHAVASVRNAVKVPVGADGPPLDILGPLGCGLLTGAGTVFRVLRPRPQQSIVVFGLGTVGLSAVMAAAVAGCDPLIGIDPNPLRRRTAEALGCTHTLDPAATEDIAWSLAEITGLGADFTVDTVGSGTVVRQALEALRTPGSCATLGLQALENDITIDQGHLLMGRTLTGVIEGDAEPRVLIPHLIDLWHQGRFPFDRLVERFPFHRVEDAVEAARTGKVVKPVLVFD
ncbi:NAD(P)-dependent alcohol dehydrogenase [Streptomyces sp. NPDC051172]|uniref:NAD(P)-dependent alcohol dehydrogenase n=1 Tax=Streptomyces sp. NPDC051172 TaxID=3155796 RepID=UPI00344AD64C